MAKPVVIICAEKQRESFFPQKTHRMHLPIANLLAYEY